MQFSSESELLVLEKIRPELERDGYSIISDPRALIPGDIRGYSPDFVARKGDSFIAIEIKSRRTPAVAASLDSLKKRIEANKNWTFRVYYSDDEIDYENLPRPSQNLVQEIAREALDASNNGFHKAAFLLAWAAFEAAARATHPRIFAKPQTPGRIITVLAEMGIVTPEESAILRTLSLNRNLLIHGRLDIEINARDVDALLSIAARLAT